MLFTATRQALLLSLSGARPHPISQNLISPSLPLFTRCLFPASFLLVCPALLGYFSRFFSSGLTHTFCCNPISLFGHSRTWGLYRPLQYSPTSKRLTVKNEFRVTSKSIFHFSTTTKPSPNLEPHIVTWPLHGQEEPQSRHTHSPSEFEFLCHFSVTAALVIHHSKPNLWSFLTDAR